MVEIEAQSREAKAKIHRERMKKGLPGMKKKKVQYQVPGPLRPQPPMKRICPSRTLPPLIKNGLRRGHIRESTTSTDQERMKKRPSP
jgi:hypothetical protein